jgi:hypothetical protein
MFKTPCWQHVFLNVRLVHSMAWRGGLAWLWLAALARAVAQKYCCQRIKCCCQLGDLKN